MLNLSAIKNILLQAKPELQRKYHVLSLGIFGSAARGEETPSSDIDIIVEFDQPVGIEFIDLANELERKLNRKVDLVSKNGIKEQYFRSIQPDIQYV